MHNFFKVLEFTRVLKKDWSKNRPACPSYECDAEDGRGKCRSIFNGTGICREDDCPVMWRVE